MRTIKFRGQTIDNKWVYGDLIQIGGGALIYHGSKQTVEEIPQEDSPCAVGFYPHEVSPIKPKTICQFTGFLDQNDVEIYENDVINAWGRTMTVQFETFDTEQGYAIPLDDSDLVVIGNIFDNPEIDNQVFK